MTVQYDLDWLRIAENVSQEAGDYLRQGLARSRQINFQDESDVKLQADLDSENLIRKILSDRTQLPVIGEEKGGDPGLLSTNSHFWVVDPLDGTYNYLRNQPQTCVSIGLMQGTEFIGGVVYDFNRNELFSGSTEKPLSINNEFITPRWADALNQACLMTGFPARMDCSEKSIRLFVNQVHKFKKVRMIGSAAIALSTVASGRADAYFENSICLWDIAAGAALVKAAGGYIKLKPTDNPFVVDFWAAGREEWLPRN